ncbi:murein transglycosylase [Actinoplanes friuliensis]|nr:murein transglycosylase [Actinoplanes friuliensis]
MAGKAGAGAAAEEAGKAAAAGPVTVGSGVGTKGSGKAENAAESAGVTSGDKSDLSASGSTRPALDEAASSKPGPQTGGSPAGGSSTGDATSEGNKTGDKTDAGKTGDSKATEATAGAGKASDRAEPVGAVKPGDSKATEATADAGKTSDGAEVAGAGKPGDSKATEAAAGAGKAVDGGKAGKTVVAPSAAAVAAASRGRATRVLRAANPVRVVKSTARGTSAWAKRPSGRLILPAVIAVVLLGAAGTAGAYLVPQALQSVPSPSVTPGFGEDAGGSGGPVVPPSAGGVPGLPLSPSAPVAGGTLPATQPTIPGAPAVTGRPADALNGWAQQAGMRAGIPVVAVQAYGYAELVVARTAPSCHLTWTTIAAIAKVESSHGSANGAVLSVDGSVAPPIFGLPLDGKGGRQLIQDTDQGTLDGDAQFDRAMGPLQFIPQTWTSVSTGNSVDADNNGVSDPNDIDDASLAAAKYLCAGGRDLSKPDAWWDAILSYNAVRPYAQKVFDAANEYGQRSRV